MTSTYQLPFDRITQARHRLSNSRPVLRETEFRGLPITIEIDKGTVKSGVGEDGVKWSHEYQFPYGEIPNTHAISDGDPVDVYIGTDTLAPMVFVVHQLRFDKSPDEDKCFLGFSSEADAIEAYRSHGPPWGFGSVDSMSWQEFVKGYLSSNRMPQ